MAQPDISKIISVIMENPALIAEIKDMMAKSEAENEIEAENQKATSEPAKREAIDTAAEESSNAYEKRNSSKRADLLRAIRPYVSKERGKAIESMISIADVIFAIKEK